MTTPRAPRLKPLYQNLLLLAVFTLISVVAGEVALRWLGFRPPVAATGPPMYWDYDPHLGWRNRPNLSPQDTPEALFPVHINSRGLRGPERAYARPGGKRRILLLGDSFAWGWGVADSEAFGALLERTLPDCEVINGGVAGYGSDQELLWLRREGIKYRPDLVLLQYCGNDDQDNRGASRSLYFKPYFVLDPRGQLVLGGSPVPRATWGRRVGIWLASRTSIGMVLKGGLTGLYKRFARPRSARVPPAMVGAPGAGDDRRFALTRAILAEMRRTSTDSGARWAVVLSGRRQPQEEGTIDDLIDLLRADGHLILDPELSPELQKKEMLCDGFHWNAEGHRFVAARLPRFLDESALLASPAADTAGAPASAGR